MINLCLLVQIVGVMVGVAFYTLLERKLLGYLQNRKGPNKPSIAGILTPFADAVKLITKERNIPERSNKILFIGVPWLTLMVPLLLWRVYPRFRECVFLKYSVLWVLCVSSVGVYALLGAGWSRNSKYSMFGAIRAVAQTVSYEVRISIIIIHSILFYQLNHLWIIWKPIWFPNKLNQREIVRGWFEIWN